MKQIPEHDKSIVKTSRPRVPTQHCVPIDCETSIICGHTACLCRHSLSSSHPESFPGAIDEYFLIYHGNTGSSTASSHYVFPLSFLHGLRQVLAAQARVAVNTGSTVPPLQTAIHPIVVIVSRLELITRNLEYMVVQNLEGPGGLWYLSHFMFEVHGMPVNLVAHGSAVVRQD